MSKFQIGDEVKITTLDRRSNGKIGVIVGYEPDADCPYIVEFDSAPATMPSLDYEWAFVESELTLVIDAQDASAAAGDAVDPTDPVEQLKWAQLALDEAAIGRKKLERERDAMRILLAGIEAQMPLNEPREGDWKRNYAQAYSAWVAGGMIRAYFESAAAQAADGDVSGGGGE